MEKTQHDIAKQSKKESIFMLKSAIFKDPWSIHSNSNILSWEMSILTTITHILLAPSHFTWLMLLLFLHSYAFCFIHFSYWAHIRQHFVCSISAMQIKKPSNNKRKIGTESFLTRWYQYLLDSWLVSLFFFLFRISTSIYVIVIIRNRIRGEILNIFFFTKNQNQTIFRWFFGDLIHFIMIEWYTFFQWYDGECHIYMGN